MNFIVAIAVAVALVAIGVGLNWYRQRGLKKETVNRQQKEQQQALKRAVDAGTHNDRGEPLCRICGDKDNQENVADRHGFVIVRAEGLVARAIERLGAPVRYRISDDKWDDFAYCRVHHELAHAELRSYLLNFEKDRLDRQLREEIELQRFERLGLDEALKTLVESHEKQLKREQNKQPASVVPLASRR